jgi:hypothetical protein
MGRVTKIRMKWGMKLHHSSTHSSVYICKILYAMIPINGNESDQLIRCHLTGSIAVASRTHLKFDQCHRIFRTGGRVCGLWTFLFHRCVLHFQLKKSKRTSKTFYFCGFLPVFVLFGTFYDFTWKKQGGDRG